MFSRANLQDQATAVMLGQSIVEDYTQVPIMTAWTVTDRSMQGQSFPRMKKSSVLLRLNLRWCAAVHVEMSASHYEMCIAMSLWVGVGGVRREENKENSFLELESQWFSRAKSSVYNSRRESSFYPLCRPCCGLILIDCSIQFSSVYFINTRR